MNGAPILCLKGAALTAGSILLSILVVRGARADSAADQDWRAAFTAAKAQKRLIFVDYYATWCGPCKVMDATVLSRDDVKEQLLNFVLLRIDVDQSAIARSRKIMALPAYVVYDPGQREVIRIVGAREPKVFLDAVSQLNVERERFVRASDLYDERKNLEAAFVTANAFMRLRLTEDARSALSKARKLAEDDGKIPAAQTASIEEAFTFSIDGNMKKSIRLLQQITHLAMDKETAATAWLTLGQVEARAKDIDAARDAYEHVQRIAAPDTPDYKQAADALTKLN